MNRRQLIGAIVGGALIAPHVALAEDADIETILSDAATRLQETDSMSFKMELEGTTYVDEMKTIQLLGAEGVMQRPDRVDVTFTALVLKTQQISIRMITVGEDAWITDIVTGKWVPSPPEFGYNPSVLYDDTDGLGPVMGRMDDPQLQDSEKIDGRETWHITATVEGEVTQKMTSGTMRGTTQSLEVWIDKENSNLLRIRIAEPTDEDLDDPATWTLTLSDHGKDVKIERPD
ncbi:MAG: LppX_LprAFG lipoprotein [Thermomicrobiales bacterium]|nr:LppX_LprAFG lipoprotein [Thermomicrobiales bacterium]